MRLLNKFGGIFLFFAFLVPQVAFGAYTYTRTPSGASPTNPVNINVSVDDIVGDWAFGGSAGSWKITIHSPTDGDYLPGDCIVGTSGVSNHDYSGQVGLSAYRVDAWGWNNSDCSGSVTDSFNLEGTGASVIFTFFATPSLDMGGLGSDSYSQSQTNLFYGFILFFVAFACVIFYFKGRVQSL